MLCADRSIIQSINSRRFDRFGTWNLKYGMFSRRRRPTTRSGIAAVPGFPLTREDGWSRSVHGLADLLPGTGTDRVDKYMVKADTVEKQEQIFDALQPL